MRVFAKFVFIGIVCFQYSCNGHHPFIPKSECVDLNNKGVKFLEKYQVQSDKRELKKAIFFLNEATKCEPKYSLAYINLANAYDYQEEYKQELNVYKKVSILSKYDPTILTNTGMVFEKLKLIDSAKITYQLARQEFERRLSADPKNVNCITGLLLVLALTNGKESALQELNKRTSLYPELAYKMASEQYFYQGFNKADFFYHKAQQQ